ncbi:hypothetical protein Tco_0020336 [Tanacetum coccineum]
MSLGSVAVSSIRVTKIVLLELKSVPLTSCFVGTQGCIFNKGLFGIFHAVLSVVGTTIDLTWGSDSVHLSRLRWSKVSFHQALDLILEFDEEAVRCTQDILRKSDCLNRLSEIPCHSTFFVIEAISSNNAQDSSAFGPEDFPPGRLSMVEDIPHVIGNTLGVGLILGNESWKEHPFAPYRWCRIKEVPPMFPTGSSIGIHVAPLLGVGVVS